MPGPTCKQKIVSVFSQNLAIELQTAVSEGASVPQSGTMRPTATETVWYVLVCGQRAIPTLLDTRICNLCLERYPELIFYIGSNRDRVYNR